MVDMSASLAYSKNPLAQATEQLRVLNRSLYNHQPFDQALQRAGVVRLRTTGIQVRQHNLGKFCNQACRHCHVDAAPDRRESMSLELAEACLQVLDSYGIPPLD